MTHLVEQPSGHHAHHIGADAMVGLDVVHAEVLLAARHRVGPPVVVHRQFARHDHLRQQHRERHEQALGAPPGGDKGSFYFTTSW